MNRLITILLLANFACVPVKIAPRFKANEYKILVAKKFKRKLPRETSFIFKDPKNEDEFYNFINTKFQLKHNNVGYNVPFQIENETFYLSYSETDKEDKTLNLPLVIIDAKRESNGNSPLFENNYSSRKDHWYILLTVYDENIKNCLLDKYPKKAEVVKYLKALKDEYLNTTNYQEILFTKKP